MEHRQVGLDPEHPRLELDRAEVGAALVVAHHGALGRLGPLGPARAAPDGAHGLLGDAHRLTVPFAIGVLTESRTTTIPPREPGTAPFTSSSWRSGSADTTMRLSAVT